jgi:class 3 adenylate cyclase
MESGGGRRKLTTIVASDVEGFSRLMSEDEEATLATLRDYRSVIFRLITRHEGRVFSTGGDSVLAEFSSAVEAVRCAISIQEELRVRNAEMEEEQQLRFRIGINIGDVLIEGDDLFGDGVNVAARLEGLAPMGGICISGSVFDQVKNKLSLGFEDIGPQQVKNIAEPVHAYKLVPAPVSVMDDTPSKAAPAKRTRRMLMAALAVVILVIVVGGGAAMWRQYYSAPVQGSLESLMAGMIIKGTSNRTGNQFEITLNGDGTANVRVRPPTTGSGAGFSERGKWWVEKGNFCMQFTRFGQGRLMCPRIEQEGGIIKAYRQRDGNPISWTFTK